MPKLRMSLKLDPDLLDAQLRTLYEIASNCPDFTSMEKEHLDGIINMVEDMQDLGDMLRTSGAPVEVVYYRGIPEGIGGDDGGIDMEE